MITQDLKSSKPNVKPLILKIGNSLLSDIVNCFDQLNESSKVKIKKSVFSKNIPKKVRYPLKKVNFIKIFIPPLISICTLFILSYTLIYFSNPFDDKDKNELINPE